MFFKNLRFFFLSNSAVGCKWFRLHADSATVCVLQQSFPSEAFTVLEWSSFGSWVQMPVYQQVGGGGGYCREEVSSDSLWCIADYNLLVSDENIPKALIFMTNVILFYFR